MSKGLHIHDKAERKGIPIADMPPTKASLLRTIKELRELTKGVTDVNRRASMQRRLDILKADINML